MGWCQEFGLQITADCDHAMAAGHESCSCPDCAAVCTGRFAGCSMVWVADGELVTPGSAPLALESGPVPALAQPSGTNGHSPRVVAHIGPVVEQVLAAPAAAPSAQPVQSAAGPSEDAESLRELLEDLKLEVRRLSRTVKCLADAPEPASAEGILVQVDARFEWLTKQLSDRLVVLGNEMMAMKRYMAAGVGDANHT